MNLIFFGPGQGLYSQLLSKAVAPFKKEHFRVVDSFEALSDLLLGLGDELSGTIVLMDWEWSKKVPDLNKNIQEKFPEVKRMILYPGKLEKEAISHQKTDFSADAYARTPTTPDKIWELLSDILGINSDILAGPPEISNEIREESGRIKLPSSPDSESALHKQARLNEKIKELQVDASTAAGIQSAYDKHTGTQISTPKQNWNAPLNAKIQEKFNSVLGSEKSGLIDLPAKKAPAAEEMPAPTLDLTFDAPVENASAAATPSSSENGELDLGLSFDAPAESAPAAPSDIDMTVRKAIPAGVKDASIPAKALTRTELDIDANLDMLRIQNFATSEVPSEDTVSDIRALTPAQEQMLASPEDPSELLAELSGLQTSPTQETLESDPDSSATRVGLDINNSKLSVILSDTDTDVGNEDAATVISKRGTSLTLAEQIEAAEEEEGAEDASTRVDQSLLNKFNAQNLASEQSVEQKSTVASSEPQISHEAVLKSYLEQQKFLRENHEAMNFHTDELTRLQATLRNLREDREKLEERIQKLQNEREDSGRKVLDIKAELDESKIELAIIKKRYLEETSEFKMRLNLAEDKKKIYEEKNRIYKEEFQRLGQKVKIDFKKIRERESELENQLELLKSDTQVQIQVRDSKILELKRKIDALEFNMENMAIREGKTKEDKQGLDKKVNKSMKALKMAMEILESDEVSQSDLDLFRKAKNIG